MNLLREKRIPAVIVIVLLISVSGLHFFTSVHQIFYHDFFDRLYYIPIIVSAFFFGFRGGGAVSFSAGVLFFLHLRLQWNTHTSIEIFGKYLEIAMYLVVGAITGILSDLEKKHREKTEEAYKKLSATFEKAKEAARLAAIGKVSAGVAHEIRNPLGGIKGAMEIISSEFKPDNPKYRFVRIIEKEISSINRIVEDFLSFAKPRKPDLTPSDLNNLLSSVLDLNRKNMNARKINLKYHPEQNLPSLFLDANQIKQVFLNVILNSIDAMPDGGKLEVVTRRRGKSQEVIFSDTGSGIEQDKKNQLFEPFFTTRPHGTGMGLAISRQIIKQHSGMISIKNRSDGLSGALVTISLPVKK